MSALDDRLITCPWHGTSSMAAFASEAVVRLMDRSDRPSPFSSRAIQRSFRSVARFSMHNPSPSETQSGDSDAEFLASLLHKVAYRGVPAPCSIAVEEHVLKQAQDAGVLTCDMGLHGTSEGSTARQNTGEISYHAKPILPELSGMLRACLIPELLVDDAELEKLFRQYTELCTPVEQTLFHIVAGALPDPRIALLLRPQRLFATMCADNSNSNLPSGSRVDFALEIPAIVRKDPILHVLEVDGQEHVTAAQQILDKKRDELLRRNGWQVHRLATGDVRTWQGYVEDLCTQWITEADLTPLIQDASMLRALPDKEREAIIDLVHLPLAEAYTLAFVSHHLYRNGRFSTLTISSRAGRGLDVVVDSVNAWMETFETLHGIEPQGRLVSSKGVDESDLIIDVLTPGAVWDNRSQAHPVWLTYSPAANIVGDPMMLAHPRPVDGLDGALGVDRRPAVHSMLKVLLRNVFRKAEFREGQLPIIERALTMRNVIGLLPTGSGKSLCYQLIGYTQPGLTLIVSPLRALMIDQKEGLYAFGLHRSVDLISGKGRSAVEARKIRIQEIDALSRGKYHFVLVAPERLQIPSFRDGMQSLGGKVPIPYCVIDEVHCISEWGHDFRPAYLNVNKLTRDYCEQIDVAPPVLYGLTATASKNVLVDIKRELDIPDSDPSGVVQPKSFNRPELRYRFIKTSRADHLDSIYEALDSLINEFGQSSGSDDDWQLPSGLIFHYFVNGSGGSDSVTWLARSLSTKLRTTLPIYAGKKPKGKRFFRGSEEQWEEYKRTTQNRFKAGDYPVLVCSHSFGMGIDKRDVRFTVHAVLPRSVEEFYQQSGRAGRDEKDAMCVVVYVEDHESIVDGLWNTEEASLEQVRILSQTAHETGEGDIARNLWFLSNSFIGEAAEREILEWVLSHVVLTRLPTTEEQRDTRLSFFAIPEEVIECAKGESSGKQDAVTSDDQESILEKTLYRLVQIGVVSEYMKDYSQRQFIVSLRQTSPKDVAAALDEYLSRYTEDQEANVENFKLSENYPTVHDAALAAATKVIKFTYSVILKQRRQAQVTMLRYANLACNENGDAFRAQLLSYLGEGRFAAPVAELRSDNAPLDVPKILSLISEHADSRSRDAVEMVGACDRRLEDEPDNPALLVLAGAGRLMSNSVADGRQDLRRGIRGLGNRLDDSDRTSLVRMTIGEVGRLAPETLVHVLTVICEVDASMLVRRSAARATLKHSEPFSDAHHAAIKWLAWCLATEVQSRLESAA